jgi:hypothetical protein
MAGFDPAIHLSSKDSSEEAMDARVKPAHDAECDAVRNGRQHL